MASKKASTKKKAAKKTTKRASKKKETKVTEEKPKVTEIEITPVKSIKKEEEKPLTKEDVFLRIIKYVSKVSLFVVAVIAIFSPENIWILGPIIGALSIMGISVGYFYSVKYQ